MEDLQTICYNINMFIRVFGAEGKHKLLQYMEYWFRTSESQLKNILSSTLYQILNFAPSAYRNYTNDEPNSGNALWRSDDDFERLNESLLSIEESSVRRKRFPSSVIIMGRKKAKLAATATRKVNKVLQIDLEPADTRTAEKIQWTCFWSNQVCCKEAVLSYYKVLPWHSRRETEENHDTTQATLPVIPSFFLLVRAIF